MVSNQVAFWIALVLANGTRGGVSAYSAAYIFFQLPYGILAVSILTALTPDLAERWSQRDLAGFRRRLGIGIRTGALVLLPAAVGYVVLARPLIARVASGTAGTRVGRDGAGHFVAGDDRGEGATAGRFAHPDTRRPDRCRPRSRRKPRTSPPTPW